MTDERIKEELKPCPFCGGKAEYIHLDRPKYSFVAGCVKCGTYTNGSTFPCNEYNARKWNTRAAERLSKIEALECMKHYVFHAACTEDVLDLIDKKIDELKEEGE